MTFYANDVHPVPPDWCAPDCDDQLPLISHVGRGIAGDDARVWLSDPDTTNETHIAGGHFDNADKTIHTDWISENINGGELSYQYNLRPYTVPRTFTITFMYRRPGRPEWSWTTPAIPYIWTMDSDGGGQEEPDSIVGSGVATLFVKTAHTDWTEKLRYPAGTTREDFNAPNVGDAWVAELTFGKGGDVDVPDFDDLAKVLGITKQDVYNIIDGNHIVINGVDAGNLVEYIDKCDKRDLDHLHADLGFNSTGHPAADAFGGYDTVKQYIDAMNQANADKLANLLTSLGDLIYGVTFNPDGTIKTRPAGAHVPCGNINVFSGGTSAYLRTRDGEVNNDIKAM